MSSHLSQPHRFLSVEFVNHVIQSGIGRLLILIGFCCFVFLALYPFDWDPPTRLGNAAKFNASGNLEFRSAGTMLASEPPAWLDTVGESGTFSLRLRVRPFAVLPGKPDRIFSLSKDHIVQSLMLGQDADELVLRLIGHNDDRRHRYVTHVRDVFVTDEWRQIDLDIQDGRLQVRIDDTLVLDKNLAERNSPRNWNRSHLLALGNEHTGQRPWLGEIAEARIEVGERQDDLLRSGALRIPAEFWSARYAPRLDSIIRLEISREYSVDYIINLVCFLPLGFLLAARRQRGWPVLYAAALFGAASFGVEFVQVFFARDASIYDWILNTGGGSAGAVIAGVLKKRHIIVPGGQRLAAATAGEAGQ